MQKARSQEPVPPKRDAPSYRLLACGFRISFTPRTGVLFTCPSRYSFTIGHTGVFSLGGWSPQLHARFLGSGVTQEHHYAPLGCRVPGSHRLWHAVPGELPLSSQCASVSPTTPRPQRGAVWALPRSLAATRSISIDFS